MGRDRWLAIHKALHFNILYIKNITADSYYGQLSTAKLLLGLRHYFILSCKGDYPFKQHMLAYLSNMKGDSVWKSLKKGLLAFLWWDKKALNILMNFYVPPWGSGWKNGQQVPDVIKGYHCTLGFVDQANVFCLCYHYLH